MARKTVMGIRSAAEVKPFLQHYHRFTERNPLPEGWTVGLAGVIQYCLGVRTRAPELIFRHGSLTVTVDLISPSFVGIDFLDESGEGLAIPEMFDLVLKLIGVDVGPEDLDDYHQEELFEPSNPGGVWTNYFSIVWKPDLLPAS